MYAYICNSDGNTSLSIFERWGQIVKIETCLAIFSENHKIFRLYLSQQFFEASPAPKVSGAVCSDQEGSQALSSLLLLSPLLRSALRPPT